MKQTLSKVPRVNMFDIPVWHHHHSSKFGVAGYDPRVRILTMKASAAEIGIQPSDDLKGWIAEYTVIHSRDSHVKGRIWMSKDDLKTAFGLSEECEQLPAQAILEEHGGDVAFQGKYIRYRDWLNIPGPGTGHDGDANVSIYLDDEIKDAVRTLLSDTR